MTDKLYMESISSCYLKEFDAKVVKVDENTVILDRTLFYPLGGGQNWDTGTLFWDSGDVKVTEVRGRDEVKHHIESDHGLEVGDEECIEAANKRFQQIEKFPNDVELWLDDGSSAITEALSLLLYHPFSKEKLFINDA